MADDIENHTLRLLQELRAEMREGFTGLNQRMDAMEQRQDRFEERLGIVEGSLGTVIGAVTEIAKVQEKHSALLLELVESNRISSARLNAVEARLGRIESKTGLALQ
jgi:hypothetical protein